MVVVVLVLIAAVAAAGSQKKSSSRRTSSGSQIILTRLSPMRILAQPRCYKLLNSAGSQSVMPTFFFLCMTWASSYHKWSLLSVAGLQMRLCRLPCYLSNAQGLGHGRNCWNDANMSDPNRVKVSGETSAELNHLEMPYTLNMMWPVTCYRHKTILPTLIQCHMIS